MEPPFDNTASTKNTDEQNHVTPKGSDHTPQRSAGSAMYRGWKNACPACRNGKILYNYLKVHDYCTTCALYLGGHRADDAPPYVSILVIGHLMAPFWVAWVFSASPGIGIQVLVFFVLSSAMTYYLLPRIKGALIGLQWANYMHGFSNAAKSMSDSPITPPSLGSKDHQEPYSHHD